MVSTKDNTRSSQLPKRPNFNERDYLKHIQSEVFIDRFYGKGE